MMGLRGQYVALPSPLNELQTQREFVSEEPCDYARILANCKARALGEALANNDEEIIEKVKKLQKTNLLDDDRRNVTLVLGSHTIVDCDNLVLDKPRNKEDAVQISNTN